MHSKAGHLIRSLLQLVRSRIVSLLDSGVINASEIFSYELEFRRRLGYLQQASLAGLGLRHTPPANAVG